MNIECEVCNAVYKIKDGVIPPGRKVKYTCKNCRLIQDAAQERREPAKNDGSACNAHGRTDGSPTTDQSEERNKSLKENILRGIQDLPPMPQVLMEIHDQISGADINTKKIADSIETDQAIASKVLRLANSAYFGLSGRVSSIRSALTLFGLKGLLEVVSMAGCEKLLTGKLPGYGYESEDLWRHSLTVAYGCKILATSIDPGISDTAHLAGLIHDSGKLIMDRFVAERKAEFKIYMESEQKSFLDAEAHFFGFTHARVAREICRKWKFPEMISNAVGWHHRPSGSNRDLLSYILHMTDQLATWIGVGYDSDDVLYQLEEGTMDFLGLKRTDLGPLVSEITESVSKVTVH